MTRFIAAVVAAVLAGSSAAAYGAPAIAADAVRNKQWHLKYLKVEEAHRSSTGKGITVAVIDSGVAGHPDLAGSVLDGTDFVKRGADGRTDRSGHGTGMAGLIAAHGNGNNGALGIAPDAKVLPIRVLDRGRRNAEVGPAIDYAVKKGAKVINLSLGGSIDPATLSAVEEAKAADVVIIASAGNKPAEFDVIAPAFLKDIVAVGATNRSGEKADVSVSGAALDLMAPGEDIESTDAGGGYRVGTGTSDAAAIVSGAAALIRSKYPDMSAPEVVARLESTATDKGAPGVDKDYGHGVLNLVAALSDSPGSGPAPSAAPSASASSTPTVAPTVAAPPDNELAGSTTPLIVGGIAAVVVLLGGLVGAFLLVRRRSGSSG
ncbi:S8 family serine peptidase [Actinoplanes friuliensis]|uniref:Peptidase s8 and s53 subtilisin kexin sedolisin n=1 Tax=Actinoplanes friuliensis DSM 7358 TaxID=1246995 RepID=U5WDY2_9ACTN|nr:S8 family serine peptidase [Actinoplanes friuliensis]AGZ46126.1 peptidase s8 and s53 subtilisin kexin sedolisin [Actinoplanes friuliensis DSM 7358]